MDVPAPAPGADPPFRCARCGRSVEGEPADDSGWCQRCRRDLIRGATWRAWIPTLVVAALYGWLLVGTGLVESPALIFFLALGVVLALVTYKVARRVFFDLLRGRATGDDDT